MIRTYGKLVGIAAAAVMVVGLVGCGSDDSSSSPTSKAPAASSAPASSAPADTPSAAASSSAADEGATDATAWAKSIKKDLLAGVGAKKKFTETCGSIEWTCKIAKIHADNVGTLFVTEQVSPGELDKETAKKWATNVFNFVGQDHKDLDWVVIEDGTGTVVGQVQRSAVPMLN